MKKLLIASAVSAAFAAPGLVYAQAKPAAPAVPTLDKVLEASGISVSGYIDAAYNHADKNQNPATLGFTTHVFDQENNSFALRQFGLTVAKQPKEGFGGLVNITAGKDAQIIHSFPEASGNSTAAGQASSMFDLTQAYAQYATGPVTIIAGKFTTLSGTEVIASTGNTTFSRSILFGAVPFTHTGFRATWAVLDTLNLIAGVNNGWDQLTDATRTKTLELGATYNPIKPLNIAASVYSGKEPTTTPAGSSEGSRTSLNAVVSYQIIDPLSVGLEYLTVTQKNATLAGGTTTGDAKYDGVAVYVTYLPTPKLRTVFRYESFNDKDGFHFVTNTVGGVGKVKYTEYTLTFSYLASDSFEGRVEVREDKGDQNVFFKYGSTSADSKTMGSLAFQALYKF
jgi:hypothetical protein